MRVSRPHNHPSTSYQIKMRIISKELSTTQPLASSVTVWLIYLDEKRLLFMKKVADCIVLYILPQMTWASTCLYDGIFFCFVKMKWCHVKWITRILGFILVFYKIINEMIEFLCHRMTFVILVYKIETSSSCWNYASS